MWGQVYTLAGVVLGALGSFVATTLLEREKARQHMAIRWDDVSLQAFSDYLEAVVGMVRMANQAARQQGWNDNAPSRDFDEALRLLEEREDARAIAFERVRLVADKATIDAAHRLNAAVWELEWMASGLKSGSPSEWQLSVQTYLGALDDFHGATRDRLSMLVPDVEPRANADVYPTSPSR